MSELKSDYNNAWVLCFVKDLARALSDKGIFSLREITAPIGVDESLINMSFEECRVSLDGFCKDVIESLAPLNSIYQDLERGLIDNTEPCDLIKIEIMQPETSTTPYGVKRCNEGLYANFDNIYGYTAKLSTMPNDRAAREYAQAAQKALINRAFSLGIPVIFDADHMSESDWDVYYDLSGRMGFDPAPRNQVSDAVRQGKKVDPLKNASWAEVLKSREDDSPTIGTGV